MWNINTPEGLHNAQLWFKGHVDRLKDGALWMVPRSNTVYRMHTQTKVLERVTGRGDSAVEDVALSLGWSLMGPN